jgi:PPOX class probable F420-dependent enzyme
MSVEIPASHRDLLERPTYAVLTTIMPDGQPQSTVVWADVDGNTVRVNTARGRQKEINMTARPQVSLLAMEPDNPFRWIEVRGEVIEITEKEGEAHIDKLAREYVGAPGYYGHVADADLRQKETRVICRIKPTRVIPFGE